jgi:hypothetical protein
MKTTNEKIAALVGFLILGLSPSFVDWEQSDGDYNRKIQIVLFYVVGLSLVYYGLLN